MKMNYFVFGTNNMKAAVSFYDALFVDGKLNKMPGEGRMTLWVGDDFMFALASPFDGNDAAAGNGNMVGLNLECDEQVEKIYQKALALGGLCEGIPQVRSGRFSAYFRDLDNNKICVFS